MAMLAYQPESQRAHARASAPPSNRPSAPATGTGANCKEEQRAIAEQMTATVVAMMTAARAGGIATVHRTRFASSAPCCAPGPFWLGTWGISGSSFTAAAYVKARAGRQNPLPVTARNRCDVPGKRRPEGVRHPGQDKRPGGNS